ncbi:MAG: hypothetical protein IJ574_01265 [Bacilli bacterium]|nr:hypothetical protein [Bacilli bacterium]
MNLIYAKDIERKDIPVLESENITKYLLTVVGSRTDEYNNTILEYNVENYPIFYKGHERLKDIEAYNYSEFPGYLAVKYE